jgi:hypothetical protein
MIVFAQGHVLQEVQQVKDDQIYSSNGSPPRHSKIETQESQKAKLAQNHQKPDSGKPVPVNKTIGTNTVGGALGEFP